jgi:hypothetical protein
MDLPGKANLEQWSLAAVLSLMKIPRHPDIASGRAWPILR